MSKAGERIIKGAREALAYARDEATDGFVAHVPEQVDVKGIRECLGMTQARFARHFGFTPDAVRNWEQGRRLPEGPARMLLRVIEREPAAVERALAPPEKRRRGDRRPDSTSRRARRQAANA